MKSYVIAEAATCHAGDVKEAERLVRAAAEAGADCIKFQLIDADRMYVKSLFQSPTNFLPNPTFDTREKEELPLESWPYLAEVASRCGIDFALTFFDVEAIKILHSLDLAFIKIASGDINHITLLNEVSMVRLPKIVSTGMSNAQEVERAVSIFKQNELTLMHCVSLYPCNSEFADTNRILGLRKFGVPVGYSDHTLGSDSARLAHRLGARIYEKHFRLADSPKTADFEHSLVPHAFSQYASRIKKLDESPDKIEEDFTISVNSKYDLSTKFRARRSYYFSRSVRKGQILEKSDLKFVRPFRSDSIPDIDSILNRRVKFDLVEDTPVSQEFLI